ncbi:MAG: NAD(P)H-hydrate dehydratase [Thermodesulfobacteriota bacterium]|nr:NAD(P)H-hydrate dehydratase [Thermodesulfobacteriota bacterium]
MKVASVSEMRALDNTAIEEFGITEELLMENAGLAVCEVIRSETGMKDRRFVVFCGVGNNGGDGFVIARKIHSNGGDVTVFILGDRKKFKGAAKANLDILSGLPVRIEQVTSSQSIRSSLVHSDVIVDAIFGTGLTREVGGLYRDIIALINESNKRIFSVDIPSGVHGDTGKVMGIAVKADHTITFGLPKVGNMLYPGYELCGDLYVTHISFPPSLYNAESIKVEISRPPRLPMRNKRGHKGYFGDVLFIAGASSYFGAPYFAALSFLKAGGGYSRLAAPRSMTPFIASKGSQIVFVPQKETSAGSLSLENKGQLLELSTKVDMVVIGPGLSLDQEAQQLAREIAEGVDKPLLVDGDGITAICEDLEILRNRQAETILTPHLGEMARITKRSVAEMEQGIIPLLQNTAKDLDAIVVLKGAHSLIGYPDERVCINMSGNSGMATAGAGDVLTGTIAAMFGLGLVVDEAVPKGVFLHGLAGDLAARDKGEDGITAQDILDYLPLALKMDREGLSLTLKEGYEGPRII